MDRRRRVALLAHRSAPPAPQPSLALPGRAGRSVHEQRSAHHRTDAERAWLRGHVGGSRRVQAVGMR